MAPASESTIAPRKPPNRAASAMISLFPLPGSPPKDKMKAPAIAPAVPTGVIPPEVPGSTCLKFKMLTGLIPDRRPISVAHVSAVAAAREPRNTT